MAILKCKMCGGNFEVTDEKIITCEYCGSTQTIPNVDSEKRNNLHNRANSFRLKNEFDKAIVTYENIVEDFNEDSEAYWGLVLCKYGIEYVDDPKTAKKIPTCHRTRTQSIFDDLDYLNAIKFSDVLSRELYEKEATEIDRLQKEILKISQKEEPYDIFICYKESDKSGKRTIDSVIAQDIYNELTKNGYKVFFARITLETKLGSQYEPIIYAALTSSKAMLVIGTKPEYFNAVWVKNEWSRFIDMMNESNEQKYIIPCYKGIDAYELPDELLSYQCQDLSRLGFMQDLTRGLDKIFEKDKAVIKQVSVDSKTSSSKFERIQMLIEEGVFKKAKELVEEVLNNNFKDARAYVYSLLIELQLRKEIYLNNHNVPLTEYSNYNMALRYADETLKNKLIKYNGNTLKHIQELESENLYKKALGFKTNNEYLKAIEIFEKISNYNDASQQIEECQKLLAVEKEKKYQKAIAYAKSEYYSQAIFFLGDLEGYRNSKELIEKYKDLDQKLTKYNQALELIKVYKLDKKYKIKVRSKYETEQQKKYLDKCLEVIKILSSLGDFKNSKELVEKVNKNYKKLKYFGLKIGLFFGVFAIMEVILLLYIHLKVLR